MTGKSAPATAAALLDAVAPYGPAVDGFDLIFDRDLPPDLLPAVRVLHTGVRALLAGKRWFGTDANGRGTGPGRDGALNPAAPIPHGTVLLTVEAGGKSDRIDPRAPLDLVYLFGPPPQKGSGPSRRPGHGGSTRSREVEPSRLPD